MAARPVPERVRWTLRQLALAPTDRVLEVGCGRGTLASEICGRLAGGRLTAIDRSPTMVRIAAQRNAAYVAAGTASFHVAVLEGFPGAQTFDTVLAVNVNLFWVRPAGPDLTHVRRLLRPGGALLLCYELPGRRRADAVAARLRGELTRHGFTTAIARGRTGRGHALLAVTGRPQ